MPVVTNFTKYFFKYVNRYTAIVDGSMNNNNKSASKLKNGDRNDITGMVIVFSNGKST